MKRLMIFLALMSTSVVAQQPNDNGTSTRLGNLEELTRQQQGEIDQNATDIQTLQSGGSGSRWVIMDSDNPPKIIGETYPTATSYLVVDFQVDGTHAFLEVGTEGPLGLTGKFASGQEGYKVYFTDNNCVGESYGLLPFGFSHNFLVPAIAVTPIDSITGYEKDLYRQSGPPETVVVWSALDFYGNCDGVYQPDTPLFPLEHFADLLTEYPPPYSLVKQ